MVDNDVQLVVEEQVQESPVEMFQRQIRLLGVPGDLGVQTLPPEAEGQWALLAPYLGRPLREIPPMLILLFSPAETQWERRGFTWVHAWMHAQLQCLPPAQTMVLPASTSVFI